MITVTNLTTAQKLLIAALGQTEGGATPADLRNEIAGWKGMRARAAKDFVTECRNGNKAEVAKGISETLAYLADLGKCEKVANRRNRWAVIAEEVLAANPEPKADPVKTETECAHRAEYRALRNGSDIDNAEFDSMVAGFQPANAEMWVKFARLIAKAKPEAKAEKKAERAPCGRCAQTGKYITGTVNGKPVGPGGDCYRCAGKGYQTREDEQRNETHDRHFMSRVTHSM